MEKRFRSSLHSSPDEFLSSISTLTLNSSKPHLKTLIHSVKPSWPVSSSLPHFLHRSISLSITSLQHLLSEGDKPLHPKSPKSPPCKRPRRSSRRSKARVDPESNGNDSNLDQKKQKIVDGLRIYAYLVQLCISHPKNAFSPEDLFPGVRELHDNLKILEFDSVLSSEILGLCEEWWKRNLPEREMVVSLSLPFLLSRSLMLKKKVDVHRVYMLREAFSLFDFDDSSIEDLKLLMMRCVISPLYLKTEDGRRFIAFMFGLSKQIVKEALAIMKSQIPFGRKSILEAFGEILFWAWKAADAKSRDEIEKGFLQSLIEGAIYASTRDFCASIRRVLGGFVNQRTNDGVEKLLFRLAEPLMFRSLQVANSNVRQNALHLLLDLFPLEDPDCTKEVKDTLMEKQFFLLERALKDECPDVRVVAIEGSCRILHLFWEVLSSSSITKMIATIFDDMSHDVCNEVRHSTVNGIIYLLGNPHSHEILKVLLPRFGHLMLDSVLRIRVAVADLLLLLSDIRGFHFNKVVGLDVLLSVLANDQPLVARKIAKLLMPSYFPSNVNPEEACSRCITLIKRSPRAGAKFCEFAIVEGASLKSMMELVKVLIDLVISQNKLDTNQADSLLLASACLCSNLSKDSLHKNALKNLLSTEKVKRLYAAACTERARSSVMNIVSTILPDGASAILKECMALVTKSSNVSEDVEKQAELRSAHRLLMCCDGFDNMFRALTRLLQKAASSSDTKFGNELPKRSVLSEKRKKSRSSVKKLAKCKSVKGKSSINLEEDYRIAVGVSWQIKELLICEDTRKLILRSPTLKQTFVALRAISEISILQCLNCDYMDITPVMVYGAFALHMISQSANCTRISSSDRRTDGDNPSVLLEESVLDQTVDHLLNCAEKLFGALESESYGGCTGEHGPVYIDERRLSNGVNMLTAMLKFIVDFTAMGVALQIQQRCLKFTSSYMQYVISAFSKRSNENLQFEEDVLKDIILCLKSSFSYAAKLLNLVLTDSSEASEIQLDAFCITSYLFDLLTLTESSLGSRYAATLVGVTRSWLPDLILALGAGAELKQGFEEMTCSSASDYIKHHFPSWLSILAKIELLEIGFPEEEHRESESAEFPMFKKFVGMIVSLLRGKPGVLNAVGLTFLFGLEVELEKKNYGSVLGLLHFVCVKLVGCEHGDWAELDMMLQYLQAVFPKLEREFEDQIHEEGRESTREFFHSVRCLVSETGAGEMEE